jgi:hypothetical protein
MARARDFNKRAPRIDIRRTGVLVNSDGVESGVVVLDVSSGGFRLKVEEAPRIGELVKLRVDKSDEYPAQIRWALGDEAGGVFLSAVDYSDWS